MGRQGAGGASFPHSPFSRRPTSPRRVAAPVFGGDFIELLLERGVEFVARRGEGIVQLLGSARAEQRRGDRWIGERPGDGKRRQRYPRFGGEALQSRDGRKFALVPIAALVHSSGFSHRESRARRRRGLTLVFSREQAAGQGIVGDDA